MTLKATIRSLSDVAARLPFHVGDYDRANEAFARWRATGRGDALEVVELWLYCYTRRYFLAKFLHEPPAEAIELDDLVEKAFMQARRNLERLEQPERFASWVSVICKHIFINFRRKRRERLALSERHDLSEPDVEVPDEDAPHDRHTTRLVVRRAIDRLPPALKQVAQLRFLEGLAYEVISERTGHPSSSLRAYASKALLRLRDDPEVQALAQELQNRWG